MKKAAALFLFLAFVLSSVAACTAPSNPPSTVSEQSTEENGALSTPTPAVTPTPTPTPTPTLTPTPTPAPTVTPPPLENKTALFCGDEIAAARTSDSEHPQWGWAGRIAEAFSLQSYTNAAKEGATVARKEDGGALVDQIEEHKNEKYDFVIIEGCVSDAKAPGVIGRIFSKPSSETKKEDLDVSTFAGGLEELLLTAKTVFPDAKIGFVIPSRMKSQTGCLSDLRRYVSVVRLACEKWGINCLDLYNDDAFEAEYKHESKTNIYNGVQPNSKGYAIYASYISAFMADISDKTPETSFLSGPGTADLREVLNGKKVLYLGDSICDKSSHDYADRLSTPYYSYAGRIDEWYGTECANRAKSGASLSNVRGSNIIYFQVRPEARRKYDMVVIEGGVNDAWDSAPVGEMSDMPIDDFDEKKLDMNTMAGGLEKVMHMLYVDHKEAVILYLINFKLNSGTGMLNNMKKYVETIKQICDKWGVQYLDLYNDAWFNARFDIKTKTNSTDGVHPNGPGYDMLAPVLAEFMTDAYLTAKMKKD